MVWRSLAGALWMLGSASAPAVDADVLKLYRGVATVNERGIGPGRSRSYAVEISESEQFRFLGVELWYEKPRGVPTPDPILMVAKNNCPMVFYSGLTAGADADGQLATNATFCDGRGFMLTRARQFVTVPAAQLEAGWWFVTVTNVPVWSQGTLDLHMELRLSASAPCQASCSGRGTCAPSAQCDAPPGVPPNGVHTAPSYGFSDYSAQGFILAPQTLCTGSCACEEGWGGVDCGTAVEPLMPYAEGTKTPTTMPLSTPTIVKADVPVGNDPAVLAAMADTGGWRYYTVTVDGNDQGGAAATTVSPGFSVAQVDGTATSWPVSRGLTGFISAELQLPTIAGPPGPPPPSLGGGWAASPAEEGNGAAASTTGCQALLYFKHEDDGFTRLPSHYDFQQYSDPVAYYGGLARFHVDLALRKGRYIVGVYVTPASEAAQDVNAGSDAEAECPPAQLTVSACPSGNALECRNYAMGYPSAQSRLFVVMMIAAALPILCCLPALLCHILGWLTGSDNDDDDDDGQNGQQYQLLNVPRPGLTTAEIAAHTIPMVFDEPLPRQLQNEHCSICIAEFDEGEELRQLKCSHFFHAECIDEWLGKVDACPLCKASAVEGPGRQPHGVAVGVTVAEGGAQIDLEANASDETAAETSRLLDRMGPRVESERDFELEPEPEPEPEPESELASTESNPMRVLSSSP